MKTVSRGFLCRLLLACLAVGFPATWGCETEPTPKEATLELEVDLVVATEPPAGTFIGMQRIKLSSPGATEIHYTLDGTVPSLDSPVYREPIEITESVRLYAIAYEFAAIPSSPTTMAAGPSLPGSVSGGASIARVAFGCSPASSEPDGRSSSGGDGGSAGEAGGATAANGGSSTAASGGGTSSASGGRTTAVAGGASSSDVGGNAAVVVVGGAGATTTGLGGQPGTGTLGRRVVRQSVVFGASYLRIAENAASFTSHLPILIIQTENARPIDTWSNVFVPSTLLVFEPKDGRASILGSATMDTRMGIHVRGELAREQDKLKYTVEFWGNHANEDLDRAFLGMPADSDWVLIDPIDADTSLIKNALASELSNSIQRYAPRAQFAEVYLSTDGGPILQEDFVGFYTVMERIKRGADRVNVRKLPSGVSGSDLTGGYVLRDDKGPADFMAANNKWQFVYPDADDMAVPTREPHVSYIKSYIDDFGVALASPGFRNPVTQKHYGDYIDIDSFVDHNIINAYMKNVDGLRFSTYFHKDRDGLLEAGPIWDFDRCAGALEEWRSTEPEEWFLEGTDGTDYFTWGLWGRLFGDPAFKTRYIQRFQYLIRNEFSESRVHGVIDALAARVGNAAERNYVRWPEHRPFAKTHASEIERVKSFFSRRISFIDQELKNGLP
jgi:hypothetical protein